MYAAEVDYASGDVDGLEQEGLRSSICAEYCPTSTASSVAPAYHRKAWSLHMLRHTVHQTAS
jgi:hypothetical protein